MVSRRLHPFCAVSIALLALAAAASPARATFHVMQVEMIIGGVNGDTTAQAIQLRMRSAFPQNQLQQGRLVAYDAAGLNPVVLIAFPTAMPGTATLGSRVLIATAGFGSHSTPAMVPDFVMTNPIPATYLAAGRITFESNSGIKYWSVSFGGASYTGLNTGSFTNDANGDFGPPFAGPLPSTTLQAVQFTCTPGPCTGAEPSTQNIDNYALTAGAAVFRNFAGTAFTIKAPPPPHCPADWDNNGQIQPVDIASFINDWVLSLANGTLAADYDQNGVVNPIDVALMVNQWFGALSAACP